MWAAASLTDCWPEPGTQRCKCRIRIAADAGFRYIPAVPIDAAHGPSSILSPIEPSLPRRMLLGRNRGWTPVCVRNIDTLAALLRRNCGMPIRHLLLKSTASRGEVRLSGFGPGLNVILTPEDSVSARLIRALRCELQGVSFPEHANPDGALQVVWSSSEQRDRQSATAESVPVDGRADFPATVDGPFAAAGPVLLIDTQSTAVISVQPLTPPERVPELGSAAAGYSQDAFCFPFRKAQPVHHMSWHRSSGARIVQLFAERSRLLQRLRFAERQQQSLLARWERLNVRIRRLESCLNCAAWPIHDAASLSEDAVQRAASILPPGQPPLAADRSLGRWRIRLRLLQRLRSEFERSRARQKTAPLDNSQLHDALRRQLSRLRRLCRETVATSAATPATITDSGSQEPSIYEELNRCADSVDSVLEGKPSSERWMRLRACIPHLLPLEQHARREIQRLLQRRAAARPQRQHCATSDWCREEIEILKRRAARIENRLQTGQRLSALATARWKLADVEQRLSRAWRSRWSSSEKQRRLHPLEHALWSIRQQQHQPGSGQAPHEPPRPTLLDEPQCQVSRSRNDRLAHVIGRLTDLGAQILYFTSRFEDADELARADAHRVVCSVRVQCSDRKSPNGCAESPPAADNGLRQIARQVARRDNGAATSQTAPTRNRPTQPVASHHSGRHYLALSSSISECPAVDSRLANRFAELGIDTAGELLELKPDMFAMDAPELELGPIALFSIQAQTRLMCQIPMLDERAAGVLVSCGVTCPRQLYEQDPMDLLRSVTAGARSDPAVLRETPAWIRRARRSRSLWDLRHNPADGTLTSATRNRSGLSRSVTGSFFTLVDQDTAEPASDVFLLQSGSPVGLVPGVEAPHAQRLHRLGIHTVGELLETDVSLMGQKRVAKEVDVGQLQVWQQRARLACQVPGLSAEDVCLLVACDVSDIGSLASADADRLLAAVRALVETPPAHLPTAPSALPIPGRQQLVAWIQLAGRRQRRNAA